MLDNNIDKRDERGNPGSERSAQDASPDRQAADRQITDREVPLDAHARADAAETIHRWLDGEVSEAVARQADARQVEFWSEVGVHTEQRRRMTTPTHVTAAIMSALPDKSADLTIRHAADARMSLTPLSAAAAAAGFTALGVLIGRVIGR